jgi:hypothetical protein
VSPRRTTALIESLDDHPNADEIRGLLCRLPCVSDNALPMLAEGWHNTTLLAEARRRSLEPDSPLVLEVLNCFETVQALFADDLRGEDDYVTVDPDTTATALKAMRDAIAASYARPILTQSEHAALMKAWRGVFPTDPIIEPDLGCRADEVGSLLAAMPRLADCCHDASAAGEFASILMAGANVDEDVRLAARDEAWHGAVLTNRRRVWLLVQRTAQASIAGYCSTCQARGRDEETTRVLNLCVDAACGLLVAASVEHDIVEVLTEPVSPLLRADRPAA